MIRMLVTAVLLLTLSMTVQSATPRKPITAPAEQPQTVVRRGVVTLSHGADLQQALDRASGGTLRLPAGRYQGNFKLGNSVTLQCMAGAVLDGNVFGNVLSITAPAVTVSGCRIINWGHDLTKMDAGIHVVKSATNVTLEHNSLRGNTFGIFLDDTRGARVLNNRIEGNTAIRSQDRGNGIQLYNNRGSVIADNEIWHTRDGIYIETSNGNTLRRNYMHNLRYGIHYMYSYNNRVIGNKTQYTRTGYALMQSKFLTVEDNSSLDDENYGILMNFITHSTIRNNRIERVHQQIGPGGLVKVKGGEGKGLFIYNSLYNDISGNVIIKNEIGIHLTAGSEDNKIYANRFELNRQQVKYVATRKQEWSKDGVGNYWSDYLGWDRNNDGIGDTAFEPNDGVDKILWKYPASKILMNSPAIEMLRWAQRAFPVLKSSGVKDSFPLMHADSYKSEHLLVKRGRTK